MIVIAGPLFVDPAERGEYLARTFDVAVQARRAEGCLDFVQAPDPIDPSRINIHEVWETDDDVQRFRASGTEVEVALPRIVRAEVRLYRIESVEAP